MIFLNMIPSLCAQQHMRENGRITEPAGLMSDTKQGCLAARSRAGPRAGADLPLLAKTK